jgi:hypothetical protein
MTGRKKKARPASQLIVIDTDVLCGASATDGGPPAGILCRKVLQAIFKICHRAVISPALAAEYDHHASNFAQRWRGAMARKNKIVSTPAQETKRARGWLRSFTEPEREVVKKDLHLVLAAWETDAVILSADGRARGLFARLEDLFDLGWAPMGDDIDSWLNRGAPADATALGSNRTKAQ